MSFLIYVLSAVLALAGCWYLLQAIVVTFVNPGYLISVMNEYGTREDKEAVEELLRPNEKTKRRQLTQKQMLIGLTLWCLGLICLVAPSEFHAMVLMAAVFIPSACALCGLLVLHSYLKEHANDPQNFKVIPTVQALWDRAGVAMVNRICLILIAISGLMTFSSGLALVDLIKRVP